MLKQDLTFYIFFLLSIILTIIFLYFILPIISQEKETVDSKKKSYMKNIAIQILFFIISSAYYFLFFLLYLIIQQTQLKGFDAVFSAIMLLFCPYLINKLFDTMLPKEKLETGIKKTIIFEVLILIGIVGYINEVLDIFSYSIGIIVGYCTSLDDILDGNSIFKYNNWSTIIQLLKSTLFSVILFIIILFINYKYNVQTLAIIYGCGLGEIIMIPFVIKKVKKGVDSGGYECYIS